MDTRLAGPVSQDYPLVSVAIPVGGNRTKSLDRLEACVSSICGQDYPNIEVIVVVDPENREVRNLAFSRPVRFVEYVRPPNATGRDANARRQLGVDNAQGEILGLTNVCSVWKPELVSTALKIMEKEKVQALDGVSRRMPKDEKSFLGMFQDKALVTEWSRYKHSFLLTKSTFAQDLRLPNLHSFFMTREFYGQHGHFPLTDNCWGWDDFLTARAMVDSGGAIFCTNDLIAYRNQHLSLRLSKQFSSGMSAAEFYVEFPDNPYARRRLRLTVIIAVLALAFLLATAILMATTHPTYGFGVAFGVLLGLFALSGTYNAFKAKYWLGFLFPSLTALQVMIWMFGYLYGAMNDLNSDQEFLRWLFQKR